PPMGLKTWHLLMTAKKIGLTTVTWTRKAWDTRPTTTTDAILAKLTPAKRGEILLLHDGLEPHGTPRDLQVTCNALTPLIKRLRERGIEPTRLDEMVGVASYQRII